LAKAIFSERASLFFGPNVALGPLPDTTSRIYLH